MGSLAVVLELNLRETTFWGPGSYSATSPLAAATRLHMEGEQRCPPSTPRVWGTTWAA